MTANIHELKHLYQAIQSFMDFFKAQSVHICLKYENNIIVDMCCKSDDKKDISYKNSGLDYRIDKFLEIEIIKKIFPDFVFVIIYKHQSFEDFLQMTRQRTSALKIQQPDMKFSEKKEYEKIIKSGVRN